MIVVREMADGDRNGIEAIDTSFQTTSVFDVVVTPRKLELVERMLDKPLVKRYPLGDAFSAWASWDSVSAIMGFSGRIGGVTRTWAALSAPSSKA